MKFAHTLSMAALMSFSLQGLASTIDLVGENLYPEGIAFRPSKKSYYVGSAGNGSLQLVQNGKSKVIQAAGLDGKAKLLGVKVDEKNKRLFLLDGKAVYIYGLDNNKLIKKLPLSLVKEVGDSALNDLAIDEAGNAYITDSFNPILLKVDGASLTLSVFREFPEVAFGNQNDMPYNFNGIVLSPDQKSLILVKTNEGTLFNLNLADKKLTQFKLDQAVTKGDGLVLDNKKNLFIIRNFENTVSKIKLGDKFDASQTYAVEKVDVSPLDIPTTAAYDEAKNSLVIVNSQFGKSPANAPFKLTVHALK